MKHFNHFLRLVVLTSLVVSPVLEANSADPRVDLEAPFICEVQGDNTQMRLGSGVTTRVLEIKKTNKYETQLDEFEVGCYRTEQGLRCSDYFNIAQVQIDASEIHESCPFWKDYCAYSLEGELTYRQRNLMGLRATQIYELECQFSEI